MLHSKKVLNGHLFCCKMKHDPSMDKKYVPALEMHFSIAIEALEF